MKRSTDDINRYELIEFAKSIKGRLFLFGAGECAVEIIHILQKERIAIEGVVISNENEKKQDLEGNKVIALKNLKCFQDDGVIIALTGKWDISNVYKELCDIGFEELRVYIQNIYYPQLSSLYNVEQKNGFFSEYVELNEIGERFKTDKSRSGHNFLDKYDFILNSFRDREITLLEIGVLKGSSVKMWKRYFSQGQIIGVDINPSCQQYRDDRIDIFIGDIEDKSFVEGLKEIDADIIIDDASHLWSHQIKTLSTLFPSLKHGGVYIVEDLHTSFFEVEEYGDYIISAFEFCSGIAECVSGNTKLWKNRHRYEMSLFADIIEEIAAEVEMISFIQDSCIIIKK